MDEEIVVTVSPGEETPPAEETAAPVVIVADTPSNPPADSAVVVFSLEMLAERIAVLEGENVSLREQLTQAHSRMDTLNEMIVRLDDQIIDAIDDAETEPSEIVAEVVPPAAVETPTESNEPPRERKRKFI